MTDTAVTPGFFLGPALTEQQTREIDRQGEEAVVFALLTLALRVAEPRHSTTSAVAPTTPSVMIPPHLKPKADGRRIRPGRKLGHPGSRRPTPEPIGSRRSSSPGIWRSRPRAAFDSAVLRADMTGWRVNDKTHRLWCFTTSKSILFSPQHMSKISLFLLPSNP